MGYMAALLDKTHLTVKRSQTLISKTGPYWGHETGEFKISLGGGEGGEEGKAESIGKRDFISETLLIH